MNVYFSQTQEKLQDIEKECIKNCKILYKDFPYAEYFWECDSGWNRVIANLSYQIEALNLLCKPFNISCKATQVKEKFNGLRFYYYISKDNKSLFIKFLEKVDRLLSQIDYGIKVFPTGENGNDFIVVGRPCELIVTKHKFISKFKSWINSIIGKSYNFNTEQNIIREAFKEQIDKLIEEAEEECAHTCMHCGATIRDNINVPICKECQNKSTVKIKE